MASTKSGRPAISDRRVRTVFGTYPPEMRARLLELRRLIFATAAKTGGVGKLRETLKWGQPSYLTEESRSGTTIRIDALKNEPGKYALFVHCQTNLIADFRELYPQLFEYRGNRCIVLDTRRKPAAAALRHCISLALTYRLKKQRQTSAHGTAGHSTSPAAPESARSGRRVRPQLRTQPHVANRSAFP